MKPSLKSPLALALTLGIFLALAGGTLAVTGAFSDDEPGANAAQDQYGTDGTGATLGATTGGEAGGPGDGTVGATVGGGLGVGAGGGGAGGGGDAGGGGGAGGAEGVCPSSVRVLSGTLLSGSVAALCASGGESLVLRSGSPTEYEAKFKDPRLSESIGSLAVLFEGSSSRSCVQKLSAFDYSADDGKGKWEEIYKGRIGPKERKLEEKVDGDAGDYVSYDNEAKVRVRCDGGEFRSSTDQLELQPE